ncbi:Chloride Channel [Perkinsus chesapeaki]|uniref:Chloride Channel n=1 Tax=Perkinsus chesapeaki TaxID=330153 RepID=A0A7J6MZC7_PERCH|nr:Chloride Channel [Perkinsus chesapeaki]
MGVNGLWAALTKSHREVFTKIPLPPYTVSNITRSSLLEGRQLYVDATMFLYRFTASHSRLSMNQVMDRFSRLSFALKVLSGKRPVFVFDAKPSKIKKRHCLNQRWATRTAYAAAALAKVEKADSDEEEVVVPPRAAPAHMDARLGIWWTCMWRNFFARGLSLVRAPDGWDAEAVCAKLAARCNGVVVSEDGDALAFGAPAILRNVWRYRTGGIDEEPAAELVERAAVEEALGLTCEEFVELCVLAGCDFASRLPNLGFIVACRAIRDHGSIENYLEFRRENDGDFRLVKLFALAFDWQAAIGCFQQDLVEDDLSCLIRTDQDRAIAATCLLYGAKGRLEEGVKRISSIFNLCNEAVSRRVTNVLEPTLAPKAFFAANPWQQQFAYLTYTHVCRKNAIQGGTFDDVPHWTTEGVKFSSSAAAVDARRQAEGSEKIADPYIFSMAHALSFRRRLRYIVSCCQPSQWILLALLGFFTALLAFTVEFAVTKIYELRADYLPIWAWILTAPLLTMLAVLCVHLGSPAAGGSGIPEMKVTLTGEDIDDFLTLRTMLAKCIGLVAVQAAGLSLGSEGPFIHISGCIAVALCTYLPHVWFFKYISVETYRLQLLAVAVSAGVTATFGAPATAFPLQVTATFFFVSSLWKGFYTAIACMIVFRLARLLPIVELFQTDNLPALSLTAETLAFVILAILCGMLSGIIVYFVGVLNSITKTFRIPVRYGWAAAIALIDAGTAYASPLLWQLDKGLLGDMLNVAHHEAANDVINQAGSLGIVFAVKVCLLILSMSCWVPAGLFLPVFTIGAVAGRLYGLLVHELLADTYDFAPPAMYALVGAVCLTSGVTRTISVAVIAFELTGHIHQMTVIVISTVVAYAVAALFTTSIYDVLLHLKDLPYVPHLRCPQLYHHPVGDIVHVLPDSACIFISDGYTSSTPTTSRRQPTLWSAYTALTNLPQPCPMVPLVARNANDGSSVKLLGTIPSHCIETELESVMRALAPNALDPTDKAIVGEHSNILGQKELTIYYEKTPIGRAVDWNPLIVSHTMPTARVQ